MLDDPSGYGRIVRDAAGKLARIVEAEGRERERARHPTRSTRACSVSKRTSCFSALKRVTRRNAQNEYYITDVIGLLGGGGKARRARGASTMRAKWRVSTTWTSSTRVRRFVGRSVDDGAPVRAVEVGLLMGEPVQRMPVLQFCRRSVDWTAPTCVLERGRDLVRGHQSLSVHDRPRHGGEHAPRREGE